MQYTHRNRKASGFFTSFLAFGFLALGPSSGPLSLAAQDASLQDELARSETVPIALGVEFFTAITGETPPPADRFPSGDLSNAEMAALLTDTFALPGGIMYRLTGHPRYALRDLRFTRVLPRDPRAFPARKAVSGRTLLQTTGWVAANAPLSEAVGELPTRTIQPVQRMPANGRPPHAEWDLVNRTDMTLTDDDLIATNLGSIDVRVVTGSDGYFDISAGASTSTDDDALPVLERFAYRRRVGTDSPGNGVTSITVGRFGFTDTAENVFSGTIDGISVSRTGPRVVIDGAVGSTALLLVRQFDRAVTRRDVTYLDDEPILAPPRYLAAAGVTAPEVIRRQTVGVQLVGQIDDDSVGAPADNRDALDTGYLSVIATGPTGLRSFYTAAVTALGGRYRSRYPDGENRTLGSAAVRLNWRWYAPEAFGSRVGVTLLGAGGDADSATFTSGEGGAVYNGYVAPAVATPWSAFQGGLSNVASGQLHYSVKPIDSLVLGVSSVAIGRMTAQPIDGEPEIDPDSSNRYLGTEIGFNVGIQPSHEVKVELNSSIFYPAPVGTGFGAYRSGENARWVVGAGARIQL